MPKRLTEQQKLWSRWYVLLNFNATAAAVKSGYAAGSAATRGYELSHNAIVMQYVAELIEERNARMDVDADYVLQSLMEMNEMRLADILDEDGNELPKSQWPVAWQKFGKMPGVMEKLKNLELIGKHIDVRAWEKETGVINNVNNIMPVPTADSVEDWEKSAQEHQNGVINEKT